MGYQPQLPGVVIPRCFTASVPSSTATPSLTVAALFAGIGGIESGLHDAGHRTEMLCEVWGPAQAVLAARFPGVPLHTDVLDLDDLQLVTDPPAPQPGDNLHYDSMLRRVAGEYDSTFRRI